MTGRPRGAIPWPTDRIGTAIARVLGAAGAAAVLMTLTAPAAAADNCSGLSDCSSTVQAGIAAAAGLALGLLAVAVLPGLFAAGAVEVAAGAAGEAAGAAAVEGAIASYQEAVAAAEAASAAAEAAQSAAAAIAEGTADGLIDQAAADAAAEAAAEANAAAWDAAQAANNAQAAGQNALAAFNAGDFEAAQAAQAQAAQAAAAAEAASVDANGAAIEAQIAGVNPTGATMDTPNCSFVSQAVEDRFAGDLVSYADPAGNIRDIGEMASNLNTQWVGDVTEQGISDSLQASGDGSRGIAVIGQGGPAGQPVSSHAINVIQQGGTTFFVDGQSGQVVTSIGQVPNMGPINGIWWIPTFP